MKQLCIYEKWILELEYQILAIPRLKINPNNNNQHLLIQKQDSQMKSEQYFEVNFSNYKCLEVYLPMYRNYIRQRNLLDVLNGSHGDGISKNKSHKFN